MEMWEYHKKKPPENIPVAFYPSLSATLYTYLFKKMN